MSHQRVTDLFTKKIKVKKVPKSKSKLKKDHKVAPVIPTSCKICKHALGIGVERVCAGCRYEAKELNFTLEVFEAMYAGCSLCGHKHFNMVLTDTGTYRCKNMYGCSLPPKRGKGIYPRKANY